MTGLIKKIKNKVKITKQMFTVKEILKGFIKIKVYRFWVFWSMSKSVST